MWIRITFLRDKQFLITPFVTRLLNVGLQELLFGHDDLLFGKADGLHYGINSYHRDFISLSIVFNAFDT
jgi:hypothetical protein